jgi:isoquinoline 1-oxidoreductase beta subunit
VEIDCRPETVNRKVEGGYTGPRVTKAVFAVDVGLPINPLGLKAQMMGGIMDGIAQALSYGLHLKDGHFLEGSWEHAFYTRQWNTPPELEVIVMPQTTNDPGGAGEFGVAASMAAVACAYARATGTMPTSFPINHGDPLGFEPFPTTPPIPPSPVDGLAKAHVKRAKKRPAKKQAPARKKKPTAKKAH